MAAMESEAELPSFSSTSRAHRAMSHIVLSILTITIAGLAYLHPGLGLGPGSNLKSPADGLPKSYQLTAVDFVTASTGWVVVEPKPHTFALLHTSDAGDSWNRQLAGVSGTIGEYLRFFDELHGVLVVLGPKAMLHQTADGGRTWSWHMLTQYGGYIWSADFVDANHGWLLAQDPVEGESLRRTEDGGTTWSELGNPVESRDWAYRVAFADRSVGWLYSQSSGPYAYQSKDGGVTWRRVPLPAPAGGWPGTRGRPSSPGEKFFVAPHPTGGAGVMATVIGVASPTGRSPEGGVVLGYPPLTVRTFDGGGSVTYVYADVSPYRYSSIEYVNPGMLINTEPANQFQLSSIDGGRSWQPVQTPSTYGAIGYIDALNWWWIGSGARSMSSDAGRTWTQARTTGVPEPLPGSLQFIDATHAWFGAMAGPRPLVESTDDGGIHWKMILLPAISSSAGVLVPATYALT
jgi:photosystem II stability/assembly factor-like uncharacterized protein